MRRLKYPLKQWAAGLVQAFRVLTSSLCSSSMTQYPIIHQRSLCNPPPIGLLPRAKDFGIARRGL